MDYIKITDLEVYAHHGVLKEETILGQKFLISLIMYTDTEIAGQTDDLKNSIDYAKVSHVVKEEMENTTFNLIEALAEHLATALLVKFPMIESIAVEVKKPWAPILLPLDTVSVRIERGWHYVYLSLGANLGDREANIQSAVTALNADAFISVLEQSHLIETKPYGVEDQPDFLNGCALIRTLYSPMELLRKIHEIENAGGRERKEHWGPRTIDIDILYYDDMVLESRELTIPHIELHKRGFVLEPLFEIAPWMVHPIFGKTTTGMLDELKEDR